MKKLQIITLTALMASGVAYAALDWDGVDNLAKGASVTLSSNDSEGNRNSIVDDNNGSGWQANKDAANPDWALIDLGETKTFKDIEIKWEAARPNTYKVYVTADAPTVTAGDTESTIAEVWLTANESKAVERTLEGPGNIDDHITGDFSGRYLLIYGTEDSELSGLWGMRIFEVRVGDFSALADRISKLALDDVSVVRGETATVNVKAMTATGEGDLSKVTNLRLEASDPSVTVTDKGNGQFEVVPSAYGNYTLTAFGMADGKDLTATAKLTSNPDASTYLINESMTFQADAKNANGEDNAKNAFDGNDGGNGWMAGRDGYGENEAAGEHLHWLLLDMQNEYNIELITVNWEGASSNRYDIYAVQTLDDLKALTLESEATYGISLAPGVNARTDWFYGKELTEVRYLLLVSRENGSPYGLNLREMRLYGKTSRDPEASDIRIAYEGDAIANVGLPLTATVMDQFGNAWSDQEGIILAVTDGDATIDANVLTAAKRGSVTVEATWKELKATKTIEFKADINEAVNRGKLTVEADAKNADDADNAANAFDGNMTTGWMAGRDGYGIEEGFEPAGANEHWLKINFWRPFNLYMVSLNWEGANCNDYEVYVLDTDEVPESFDGLTPALTYYENPRQAARTDNLFGDLENVKTLLFRFRNNATGYGLNLFEVNFYGSPSEESVAKAITLETNVGEAVKINETGAALLVSAVDQYDDAMTVPVSVEGTGISYDALTGALTAEAEGSVEITAGEGDIAKTITVGSFDGSTQASIALVASATVDNGDNAAVVLNKSESTGLEDMYQPKNQNMAPYKLTIDLGKEYPADVIEVIWETAHASDFEILTGTDPNALTAAYTVAGRALRGYDNVIDRTMLEKNTPVRYIQIDVTGHAHEYPAAIRRVRLYNADSAEMLGITDITVEPAKARTIYNLQGIAVPADRMERGTIYIVDGVKMIIK